jgi:phosphatidylglycerophosphatase A
VGLLWTWLLLASHSWVFALLAIGVSIAGAIPLSSWAAQYLGDKDPSSVVIDEIVALPLVFFLPLSLHPGFLGIPAMLPDAEAMVWWFVGFALFRFFDIVKPPPIRQFQALPGGWGIVVDDLLAALAASFVLGAIIFWRYR